MNFIFHNIWDVILPVDELIFFKMVIAPPTRLIWTPGMGWMTVDRIPDFDFCTSITYIHNIYIYIMYIYIYYVYIYIYYVYIYILCI